MAKKVVALYIDDVSIRLLVTNGKQIRKWGEVPLELDMVKQSVVLKPEDVAAKIKHLFRILKIKSKKVTLGLGGNRCLTRPISMPQLPREMLEEAVRREAKRVLPVSPEQLYLSWKSVPAPEEKMLVFLVAIPRNVADSVFNTLQLAGIRPDLMDIKPLLLVRLANDPTAIVVDVQASGFDIIIKAEGILRSVRTIAFPDEKVTWHSKLSMIQTEINRSVDFYNADNKEALLAPIQPVLVSGELVDAVKQSQILSHKLHRPIIPLMPPLESPDGLNPNRYMANMGLILKKIQPPNGSSREINNLNILPTVYQPKPISLTRILLVPGVAVAVCFLLFLVLLIHAASSDISETRRQLNPTVQLLQQKLANRQQLIDTIAEFEQNIDTLEVLRGDIAAALVNLEMQSEKLNGDLAVIINTVPDTVSLINISNSKTALKLTGRATSEEAVLSYLSELNASERFSGIKITSMNRVSDQRVEFKAVLNSED